MTGIDLSPALPEIVVLAGASLVLLVDLFLPDRRRHVAYWLSQLVLLVAICVTLTTLRLTAVKGFHNMVVDDMVADFLRIGCFVSVSLTLFYARASLERNGLFRGETFVLMLFALLGMQVMITGNSFLTLYLGLELFSLSLYALVALQRSRNRASEAAMKFFVLGALSSGLLLYGMSMIYGGTGSFDVDQVARALYTGHANHNLLVFGLVFVVSGIAFKLGVVPYHMWVPDVYDGAPTPVSLFIGAAPELAGFALALRLLSGSLQGGAFDWQGMLIVLCVLSIVLGNLIAIAQGNVKRMLAYSAIANMGYMLMGFLTANRSGFSAAMFYTVAYVLTVMPAFAVVMLMSRAGIEADRIEDLKGLNQRSPWWAFIMLLSMFSLAGIPPTIGFYAKFMVFEAAINEGFVWLAVIGVLAALYGAFYYLRVVKVMYFDDPVDLAPVAVRGDTGVLLSVNGLALLVLGVLPQQLIGLCAIALTQSSYP